MTTITLPSKLAQQIENFGGENESDRQAFVEKAIQAYLMQMRREKIEAETDAFNAQYEKLRENYSGYYVAIHQGKVIDHDLDLRTLHLRVYEQVGRTPVLLKQVTNEPERELTFRSPRLERNEL